MPISRASFGLITQLLDLADLPLSSSPPDAITPWQAVLQSVRALGIGSLAEQVMMGDDNTVTRFMELQRAAQAEGLELFLRLQDLTDEALEALRDRAVEAADQAPGQSAPPALRLLVDLGQPDEEDLARWLPPHSAGTDGESHQDHEGTSEPHRPRSPLSPLHPHRRSGAAWSQALAFSVFDPDEDVALRRLDRLATLLLDTAGRPGVEQPVWLAAFGVGGQGAAASPGGVIKIAAHALSRGIERVFLAAGPEDGWWPTDLRAPPPPLQAFRTLAEHLDGATHLDQIAPGQYHIVLPGRTDRYLVWKCADVSRLPSRLQGSLTITTPLGETRRIAASRLKLTDEPLIADPNE